MTNLRKILSISTLAIAMSAGLAQAESQGAGKSAEAPAPLKAPAGAYVMDPTHASLQWSFVHNKISHYTARFNKFSAEITLDPSNMAKSSVTARIDPASVDANYPADYKATHAKTGFNSWSEDIARNKNYLNAGQFPEITFKSTRVELTGPRTAKVTGDMTFLGVTKPLTLDATFVGELEKHPFTKQPAIGFKAEGAFKRSDFGMPVGFVGDEVTIRFDGEFLKKADVKDASNAK